MKIKDKSPVLVAVAKEDTDRMDIIDCITCRQQVGEALSSRGYSVQNFDVSKSDLSEPDFMAERIRGINPLCIFNLFEGFHDGQWKEADFCEILEKYNMPFTGNPSKALRLCQDKRELNEKLSVNGIPAPSSISLKTIEELAYHENISFPAFIKPVHEDGSVGIDDDSLVSNMMELYQAAQRKLKIFPGGILIQDFLPGTEYFVSFTGNEKLEPLPIFILDYSRYQGNNNFLSYDAKWDSNSTAWKMWPEKIRDDHPLKEYVLDVAAKASVIAGCSGYLRIDLRERDGELFIIDINPNPALSKDSGMTRQYMKNGNTYAQLVEEIVNLAVLKQQKGVYHDIG